MRTLSRKFVPYLHHKFPDNKLKANFTLVYSIHTNHIIPKSNSNGRQQSWMTSKSVKRESSFIGSLLGTIKKGVFGTTSPSTPNKIAPQSSSSSENKMSLKAAESSEGESSSTCAEDKITTTVTPTISRKSKDPHLEALIKRQQVHCPLILKELKKHGTKTSHWAWWVFPTEQAGMSEPSPPTKVDVRTAHELLERAPIEWKQCLELIVEMSKKDPVRGIRVVLPAIDLPRVGYFITFWSSVPNIPQWLTDVLKGLKDNMHDVKKK
jgi:hypothetical protein